MVTSKSEKCIFFSRKRYENSNPSCRQLHQIQMQSNKAPSATQNESCHMEAADAPKKSSCVVVYLHGLNMDVHEEDALVDSVKRLYGDQVINIQPTCRKGITSARLSIDRQAKKVIAEIKEKLQAQYPACTEEALQNLPMNIFGYSQGGLVACIVAEICSNHFNIKTITAAHAPLSGTAVLENNSSDMRQFRRKAKPGLQAVGYCTNSPSGYLHSAVTSITSTLLNGYPSGITDFFLKGLADMRTNSECNRRIKKLIREGGHDIPMLLIAGYISNLTDYFDFNQDDKQKVLDLHDAYSLLTTKRKNGEHDILVALSSQLCRTASFENLASSGNDLVYPKNIEIYIAEEELHAYNLISMLSDFPVQCGQTLFESKTTMEVFTEFLGKHNNLTKYT